MYVCGWMGGAPGQMKMGGPHPQRLFTPCLSADMGTGPLVPRVLRTVREPALLVTAGAVRQPQLWPSGQVRGCRDGLAVVSHQENELGAGVLGPILGEDATAGAGRKVPGLRSRAWPHCPRV